MTNTKHTENRMLLQVLHELEDDIPAIEEYEYSSRSLQSEDILNERIYELKADLLLCELSQGTPRLL